MQRHRLAQGGSLGFLQLRPRLPFVPALLKLRLGLLQGRHTIRARHWTIDGHRPEPAQIVGTAACAVDADDLPLADNDGVVGAVLVDPGAEAGRAELETPQNRVIFATLQNFCEPALVQN